MMDHRLLDDISNQRMIIIVCVEFVYRISLHYNKDHMANNITTASPGLRRVLSDDYMAIKIIGSGSFGEVFLAQHRDGGFVAAKVEDNKKPPRIYTEFKIYRHLEKMGFGIGLPKVYEFIRTTNKNIMIMQLLGPSLEDLFNKNNKRFTLPTVFQLAYQFIHLLQQLHSTLFIHRDIKPNNFLIGRPPHASQIYIMDFGLSKKYLSQGTHMKFRNGRSLIGTARYASINMHMGIEPSRRDDLESVGYMLVYFLKGSLPWQGIKKDRRTNYLEKIGDIKMTTNLESLCSQLPVCFRQYLEYCRSLAFDETPNYDHMLQLFTKEVSKLNIQPCFQWQD